MTAFTDAIEILTQWGPAFGPCVLVAAFFLWRDFRREDVLFARIEKLETEYREVLIPLVRETTAVIAENSAVMRLVSQHLPI